MADIAAIDLCPRAPLTGLERRMAFEELVKRVKLPSFNENRTFEYEPGFVLRGLTRLDLDLDLDLDIEKWCA